MNDPDEMTDELLDELDGFDFDTDETDETEPDEPDDEQDPLPSWSSFAARPDDEDAPAVVERDGATSRLLGQDQAAVAHGDGLGDPVLRDLQRLIEQCTTIGCVGFESLRSRDHLVAHIGWHVGPALPAPGLLDALGRLAAGESHEQELRPDAGAIVAPVRHLTWLRARFGDELFTTSDVLAAARAHPEGCGLRPGLDAQRLGRNYRKLSRSEYALRVFGAGFKHRGARYWRVRNG